jgi:outer membrane protein assembly factor BamE
VTPYRIEIVQGNVVTRSRPARVKPGMTRAQVRDMLGSPLLTDPFHADRWDYVFTIRRQGTEPQRRSIVAASTASAEEPRSAATCPPSASSSPRSTASSLVRRRRRWR